MNENQKIKSLLRLPQQYRNHFVQRMHAQYAPRCPNVSVPALQHLIRRDATAAQIAGMTPCQAGITRPEDLEIDTETCLDGANWRLIITDVYSVIRTHSRLPPGVNEPIPGVNTTKENFCVQVRNLYNLNEDCGPWYMINAVRAHEEVHVREWLNSFTTDWSPIQVKIEALKVPAAGATADVLVATHALQNTTVFQKARRTDALSFNFPTFYATGEDSPEIPAAERAWVIPRIDWICNFALSMKWNPENCHVCRYRKMGYTGYK